MLNKGVSLPSFTVCKGREKGGVDNLRRCVQMPVVRACWGVTRVRVLKLMQVDLNWTLARDSESYINLPEFNEYTIIKLVYTRVLKPPHMSVTGEGWRNMHLYIHYCLYNKGPVKENSRWNLQSVTGGLVWVNSDVSSIFHR